MKKTNARNKRREPMLRHAVILMLLLTAQKLFAQNQPVKFERIGLEHGLSQNSVTCILQDRQGFMWFGTQDGLNKYDGYRFTVYKNDPNSPNSLSNNDVRSIYEDRSGVLWIGTQGGGLNKFDRKKETFYCYQHDPSSPISLSNNDVRSIYEDLAGVLWVGTLGSGLNKFDQKKETFAHFQHDPNNPNSLSDNDVTSIHEDRWGMLWIGTWGGGLNKFDRRKGRFTHYRHDPTNPYSLSNNVVHSIYEDQSEVLWIGTWGGGLNKFDREKETFSRYQQDANSPNSLSNNDVRSIYEDRSAVLWIGTWGGGLDKLDRDNEKFTHYKNNPNAPHSLSDNSVGPIYEDRLAVLWIGTWGGGLNKFDREKEIFTHYQHDPNNRNSLSHNWVISSCGDRLGALWIGTWGGGLNKFDREKEIFTHYQHDPNNRNSLSDNRVWSIYEDRSGMLWIGTYSGGLNKFDQGKKNFAHYQHDPNNPNSLSGNSVQSIYEDQSGMLWIGTELDGLNKFDREKEVFTHYQHDSNNPNSLSGNSVQSIYEDRAGMLWIGTSSGGLNKFDRATGRMTHYRERDGLPNDCIYGILEDDHGNLWLSTNNGLSKFNPQTKEFKNYDIDDGLQSKEYNQGSYYKSAVSDEMFFGGGNGFNVFHPDSVKDNPYIPPVVITALARYNTGDVAGKPIAETGISEKTEIVLSYKDNIITFEFAALNYRNTLKNQYVYKLEGFGDNWIQLGTKRDITFTNLDPGTYTLRVKGSNNDGVWNEEGASLKITITPPWWKTRLAYMIYGLLTISGFVATNRVQRRRLIKREYERAQIREGKFRAEAAEAKALALQTENERKKNVELLSEIGKEITASLDMDTIFYKLYERVNQLTDATVFGVGIYHPAKEQIEYRLAIERGKRYAPYTRDTRDKKQFPVWCIEHRRPVFINDVTVEYGRYIDEFKSANVEGMVLENGALPEEPLSLIYLPLISQDQVLGVITIQSFQKNAYTEYHLNLLQSLAAYTTIALDNADAYRRLDATLQHLKSTQQQLITQEKLASLGQLTAGIAHEIKNPLNFVNNFAALSVDLVAELREEIVKIEDSGSRMVDRESLANIKEILATLEQNAEKINHHGKRADGIVKSMMQHARGSSGQREMADVNHLLDEAVNLTYHGMRANDASFNITLEKEYDATIGKLEVVPQDLSRVFLNIANNAAFATHQKKKDSLDGFTPTLSISTKNLGDKIEIRIRDNGNGIPKDIREKIFNPFFTTKPTGQGTGLGLSISHDIIVQEHRGEIRVETEEGKFTEFVVRLPRS